MTDSRQKTAARFTFGCLRCDRPVTADRSWAGKEVRCPHCSSIQKVPQAGGDGEAVRGNTPNLTAKRYFNFVCKRCRSVLEAHTGMCNQQGHCPTCDAFFVIPPVDPRTGIPTGQADPGDDPQNPTPVHAYAASGDQAPEIVRDDNGEAVIKCPKCNAYNDMDVNGCAACGMPFTIEGAAVIHQSFFTAGSGTASMILGLISIPACMFFIPGLLAITLAWMQRRDSPTGTWPPSALVGLILGLISLPVGIGIWIVKL